MSVVSAEGTDDGGRDLDGLCTVHKPSRPKGSDGKRKGKKNNSLAAEAAAKLVLDSGLLHCDATSVTSRHIVMPYASLTTVRYRVDNHFMHAVRIDDNILVRSIFQVRAN